MANIYHDLFIYVFKIKTLHTEWLLHLYTMWKRLDDDVFALETSDRLSETLS